MKQTPKQFFATPAGKLTLAIVAMVLCWTVLIVYLSNTSAGGTWFPTEADMNRVRQDIKKDTNTYNAELAKQTAFEDLQDKYEDSLITYWNADRDGDPATELRNLINDAAQNAKANLQTLGSVRMSNINNELSYADLDFTVVDEYSKVITFFAEVEKCTPRLSWRRVEIRVEPNRARAVTGPGARPGAAATAATVTTTPAQMFRATGQVRVIKYSPAGNTTKISSTATAGKTTTGTAAKTTTAPATGTAAPKTTTPAAGATAAPAANANPETNNNQPAAASAAATPAQQGPAATATTNKENGK